ncbi:PWWP domain [Sesbania bispinosa]|nr:PWWP domain [Sesbania bispinosa]
MNTGDASRSKSGKNQVSNGGELQGANDSVALGDMIYIKLRSGSWWPAQVVNGNSVHDSLNLAN